MLLSFNLSIIQTCCASQSWSTQQKTILLDKLLSYGDAAGDECAFSDSCLRSIDAAYSFTASNNSEIKYRWQMLCLQNEIEW